MEIRRGQVVWWEGVPEGRPHIQSGRRPAVVVSNNWCNKSSGVITICPLTTRATVAYPQQAPVVFAGKISVVLADQITTVPKSEITEVVGHLQPYQMAQVDTAVQVQLGFVQPQRRERGDAYVACEGEDTYIDE